MTRKETSGRTALVTGANSGFGFAAASELAEAGWGEVILACRTVEKAESARERLVKRTGRDPFSALAVDTSEVVAARSAIRQLHGQGRRVDFMLLNAAASSPDPRFNSDGVELTYASTLIGHHVMTMEALASGVLTPDGRIVIAGSESARGNVPGEVGHNVAKIAAEEFGDDLETAIEGFFRLRASAQSPFKNMREYGTAKLFVAWWTAALARRLPRGITVNAVSPGGSLATQFGRGAHPILRALVFPPLRMIGPLLGISGSIEAGAKRYVDAEAYGDDATGHFYATAHRKRVIGPVVIQDWPEFLTHQPSQEACFEAIVKLTGVGYSSPVADESSQPFQQ